MERISLSHISHLEFEPLYNEIEFLLDQLDDDTAPLAYQTEQHSTIDWHFVKSQTESLLVKGADLRVILWHLRANLHINGISACYDCLTQLHAMLAPFAQDELPDESAGERDEMYFSSALGWLATSQCLSECKKAFLSPELSTPMTQLIDVDPADLVNMSFSERISLLDSANQFYAQHDLPELHVQLAENITTLTYIENTVNRYSLDYRLNCQPLRDFFSKLIAQLASLHPTESDRFSDDTIKAPETETNAEKQENNTVFHSRYPTSRNDVIVALDHILHYFHLHEPSHPAPLLIRRAQKMIGMDFEMIIEELLPESIHALQQFTGKNHKENSLIE